MNNVFLKASQCSGNQKQCDDGECFNKAWFGNGFVDCADRSDEVWLREFVVLSSLLLTYVWQFPSCRHGVKPLTLTVWHRHVSG